MNLQQDQSVVAITMTSLEMVDFINSQRGATESELRHDHFMAKVPKVLCEDHAPKFREMVSVAIGSGATRQSPIYRFPKREACLMAMSYSYALQAKVFDRMTALEASTALAVPQSFAHGRPRGARRRRHVQDQHAGAATPRPLRR